MQPSCQQTGWIAFGLVVVFSVLTTEASEDERAVAIAAIRKAGGTVHQVPGGLEIGLNLGARNAADELLVHVARLNDVTWLNLASSNVTDPGLARLKSLRNLRWLHLEKTGISDSGIQHLVELKKLVYLNLYSTRVTDEGMVELTKLPGLKKLYVWKTKVTTEGISKLHRKSPGLKIFSGVDLEKLAATFPDAKTEKKPEVVLKFVPVDLREDAPKRSDNGVNCQVWFENRTAKPVRLYWISYGRGELKLYGVIESGKIRKQNTYARNAWLVTDEKEKPLGYFVVNTKDARAIIPDSKNQLP